ncbi:hypothetical protein D3C72_2148470 [compost metagenome]
MHTEIIFKRGNRTGDGGRRHAQFTGDLREVALFGRHQKGFQSFMIVHLYYFKNRNSFERNIAIPRCNQAGYIFVHRNGHTNNERRRR